MGVWLTVPPEPSIGFLGIQIEGVDEVLAVPKKFRDELRPALAAAINKGLRLTAATAIPMMPEWRGEALQSLVNGLHFATSEDLEGRFGSDLPRFSNIEFGQRVGVWPPSAPLEAWAADKLGIGPTQRVVWVGASATVENRPSNIGFLLARAISRRGNPKNPRGIGSSPLGWHVMERAWDATKSQVEDYITAAVDGVISHL